MKKYLCLMVAAMLTLTCLIGCGKQEAVETTAETAVRETVMETTEAATEPTTESTGETTEQTEETTVPTEAVTEPMEPEGARGVVCNTSWLNVRKGPGTDYERVNKLARGTEVIVYETVTKHGTVWGRIDEGWVSMKYIRLDGALPEPTQEPDEPVWESTEDTGKETEPTGEETQPVEETTAPTEPEHEHVYKEKVTAPTCTEDGFTTYTCKCGDSYRDNYVNSTGHEWSQWKTTKEPTETAEGEAQRSCSRCDQKESKTLPKRIPDHTHKYTEKVTKEPTCTSEGIKTFTCSCGDQYTQSISRTEHKYSDRVTAPTCTEKGCTTHTCRTCGHSYKDSYTDPLGHDYKCKETAPTCDFDGKKVYTCSACKDSYTVTIPRTGHDYQITEKAPTCTEAGFKTYNCKTCGDTATEKFSATGHKWGSWKTEKEPTETSTGLKSRTCSVCNKKETQTIDKLPSKPGECSHQYEVVGEEPPACGHSGAIYKRCRLCGDYKVEMGDPLLGHNYILSDHADPTCTVDGYDTWTCTRCGDSGTDILPASHHWEHHYEGEVGHWETTIHCHCGWSCSGDGDWMTEYRNHLPDEWYLHSYYDTAVWVIDVPGVNWDECTVCGATK